MHLNIEASIGVERQCLAASVIEPHAAQVGVDRRQWARAAPIGGSFVCLLLPNRAFRRQQLPAQ
jgi:hypothetical protein